MQLKFKEATIKEVSLYELLQEMWKTFESSEGFSDKVLIKANPQRLMEQKEGLRTIEKLIDEAKEAKERDGVLTYASMCVGYANAMCAHETITTAELQRLNAMIGAIAQKRMVEVEKLARRRIFDRLRNFGKVEI